MRWVSEDSDVATHDGYVSYALSLATLEKISLKWIQLTTVNVFNIKVTEIILLKYRTIITVSMYCSGD